MQRKLTYLFLFLGLSIMISNEDSMADDFSIQPGQQTENWHTYQEADSDQQVRTPFLLFTPTAYNNDTPQPLLLFLHGFGESGMGEFDKIKIHGPPKVASTRADFPFVTISPQCPVPTWEEIPHAWRPEVLKALVEDVASQMNIDRQRVYVTGLSMGGFGTWRIAGTYPEFFAAAAPICGGGKPEWASNLAKTPIWAFHGAKDSVVPLQASKSMVDGVQLQGGDVKLTIYPHAEHDSWTETYNNPKLYEWLLRQTRQLPASK